MHDAAVFTWSESLDAIDWRDVETLYCLAPLGNKSTPHLQRVGHEQPFPLLRTRRPQVELSRGHKKIILYAVPGKEAFYRKLGFERMLTAMAIFEDQAGAFERGYLSES
jgi:hypothetical protein